MTLICQAAQGAKVNEQQALQKAQLFMPGKQFVTPTNRHRSNNAPQRDGDQPYYVFNVEQQGGFVIVSGDDRTETILGYSTSGTFDPDNIPDNMRWWLDEYARQLKAIDNHQATPAPKRAAVNTKPAIEPLIKTVWNQYNPYDLLTPTYKTNTGLDAHYPTGCVATAIAQVMYYWQWPKECPAIPAYTTSTLQLQLDELPPTTFKWDLMKLDYDFRGEVNDSALAVAELMRYVGQSMTMDYMKNNSGSNVSTTKLIETFNYSRNLHYIDRVDYTITEWENIVYQELDAGRPLLYEGASLQIGHEFICDGYDGNGLFHLNWGWGGDYNGYFVLSLANHKEEGIEAGEATGGYSSGQSAIIGMVPPTVDVPDEPEEFFVSGYYNSFPETTYSRTSPDEDFKNVSIKHSLLSVYYNYTPTTTNPIEAGWALLKDGKILKVIATTDIIIDNRELLPFSIRYYAIPSIVNFGAGLPDGSYQLVQVWRPHDSNDWTIIYDMLASIDTEIVGNELNVRFTSHNGYTIDDVTFSGEMAAGTENMATVTLTNTGNQKWQEFIFWLKTGSEWKEIGLGDAHAEPGKTGFANIKFSVETPGNYEAKITTVSKKDLWQSTITIHELKQTIVNDVRYGVNPGTNEAKVLGFAPNNYPTDLEIPSTISYDGKEYPVTRIGNGAFTSPRLRNAIIPDGIIAIGNDAFRDCNTLKTVKLPSTLREVGRFAFANCPKLTTIVCEMQNPHYITSDVFQVWSESKNEYMNTSAELYVPEGTKDVYQQTRGWNLFQSIYEGDLREETIDNLTYLYATCKDYVDIVKADVEAFNDKDLVIPASVIIDGKTYKVRKIEDNVFLSVSITSLTIEPGLEEIGNGNFRSFDQLKEVVIPEGVKIIGADAFKYGSKLERLYLPSTLEQLGDGSFYSCRKLKAVICSRIEPCLISGDVFHTTTATLYVPEGSKESYKKAQGWNNFPMTYEGEPREQSIDNITYSFATGEDFADITKADIDSLNNKDLVIPGNLNIDGKNYKVRKIADSVFREAKIKSLTIEPGLEEIGDGAFHTCSSVEKVILPEGIKTIGSGAFCFCYDLEELRLPSTLENLGEKAFYNSMHIKVVVSAMQQPCPMTADVFQSKIEGDFIFTTALLYVPLGAKEVYQQAEGWKLFQVINTYETDISKLLLEGQKIQRIYTLSGNLTEHLQKGLNIVVMDDGTTKKVVVR